MSFFVGILSTMGWAWLVLVGVLLAVRARQLAGVTRREHDEQRSIHPE